VRTTPRAESGAKKISVERTQPFATMAYSNS
jgi:hypothetical protein